jgi:50S ribosomal protein L16 3-hydroxylase
MKTTLLGGLTPRQFLRGYWQKKPLLIRGAIPGFQGIVSRAKILALAQKSDAQSRLISYRRGKWQLENGPFRKTQLQQLPRSNWTILIQDLNHFSDAGTALLRQFSFIPYARLDDLMVSYAARGGGVGPHFDSYDVFLLQGEGTRRWRISRQKDLSLIPDLPLKILRSFRPEMEWELHPGDMLYLPPGYAHEGVALSDCATYSVGFRAPSAQELAFNFLNHVQDELALDGMYGDPELKLQRHPAEIGSAMVNKTAQIIQRLSWTKGDYIHFLGRYLTEPKPHVYFAPPAVPVEIMEFRRSVLRSGALLDRKSRLLTHDTWAFMNGDRIVVSPQSRALLRELSDYWMIQPRSTIDRKSLALLYAWYCDGYLQLRTE